MLNNPLDKWSGITEKSIMLADFHILIESHYEAFKNYENDEQEYGVEELLTVQGHILLIRLLIL